jgi:predicted amidohydrolase
MQQVCSLIAEKEYKRALVRLWHLAHQPVACGGQVLDQWARLPVDDLAKRRIEDFFAFGQTQIAPRDVQSRPTDVIRALDERLREESRKPLRATRLSIDDWSYFLVSCAAHDGFEQDQPVRFANYMRHHRIITDQLSENVRANVADLCAYADLQHQLEGIAQSEKGSLTVGLGLFPDKHQLQGEQVQVDPTRRFAFFTTTSGEGERLVSARAQLDAAETAGVELLVFPELTLSPSNQQAIQDHLWRRWREHQPCRIPIIVLGSFHCRTDGCQRNRAQLLWGFDGTAIASHDKLSPATLGEVTENLTPGPAALFLCTPIGNISLAICKDIIDDRASLWIEKLGPDWLLVPSLSNSASEHVKASRKLWNRHRCTAVVANQPLNEEKFNAEGTRDNPLYGYIHSDTVLLRSATKALWYSAVSLPGRQNHPKI